MRTSTKLLLLGSLLSNISNASEKLQFHCWDDAYTKTATSLVETDRGYEFGIAGPSLGPLKFTFTSSTPVYIEEVNRSRIFVAYSKKECTVSSDKKQATCEKVMIPNLHLAKFFVEQTVPNFDQWIIAMTPVGAAKVKLNYFYNNSIKVEFTGANGSIDSDNIQNLNVLSKHEIHCSHEAKNDMSVLFPDSLREYLKTRRPGRDI